jgi:hypothetical protein
MLSEKVIFKRFVLLHNTNVLKEVEERKNLLNQFRKWKEKKRKTFNIVVTEKGRREMAGKEMEKSSQRGK